MNKMLDDKVAIVTGATRGIGLATTIEFVRHGAKVVMFGRNVNKLNSCREVVLKEVPDAKIDYIECDVSNPESVKIAFQSFLKHHKKLNILVSNAGVLDDALIGMVNLRQIENTFGTNTYGVIFCAQYACRLMGRSGGGSIINISSIIGTTGNIGQAVYGGSKAAVIGITKSLAKELAFQKIRVNAISPGFIQTDMANSIGPEKFKERVASIKMGYAGSPVDIANTALFLASDLSSYVTGQVIGVDGGMLI